MSGEEKGARAAGAASLAWRPLLAAPILLALAADPAAAAPQALRPEISIRRIVETGSGGSSIRIAGDPSDGALYYLRRSGSTYRLTVAPGEGSTATRIYTGAETGVPSPFGFAFGPDGTLYIVGNQSQGARTIATVRKGVRLQAGADARAWSTVARTEPYPRSNTAFDHNVNGIAVSPEGAFIFLASGSRTDHGEVQTNGGAFPGAREVPLTSAILRIPAGAADLLLEDDEEFLRAGGYLHADGVRNSFDLAFAPNGDLFAGENSGDRDDSEELNWIRGGAHYGFPWRMGTADTPQRFPGYDPEADRLVDHDYYAYQNGFFQDDPTYPDPPAGVRFMDPVPNAGPDGDSFRDPATGAVLDASDRGEKLGTFTAHRSPLGLVFDAAGALGGEYRGGAFILSWTQGDAAGDSVNGPFKDPGEDMLHLELTKTGDGYQLAARRVAGGFENPIDAEIVLNQVYVLEHGGNGAIWEVTFPADASASFRRGLVNRDGASDLSDAVAILFHLFGGQPVSCPDAADADDSGVLDVTDAIYFLEHLFRGGAAPPPPHGACGRDPTADPGPGLGCEDGPGCAE